MALVRFSARDMLAGWLKAFGDNSGYIQAVNLVDSSGTELNPAAPVLSAGTAVIGKVGIDQTTPGTTNAVVATGNVASAGTDSGNPVKVGGRYNSAGVLLSDGQRGDLQLGTRGSLNVTLYGANSTSPVAVTSSSDGISASTSGLFTASFGLVFNGATWDRVKKPSAASRIVSAAASTNATSAKASAGDLHCVTGYNAAATVRYVKFYNKATAPTVGTDTPVLTFAVPPTSGFALDLKGHYFATGIAYALTTGGADADTGALTAGDILGLNVTYA